VHLLTDTEVTFLLTSGGHNVGIVNPPGDGFPGRHYQVSTRPDQSRYIDPETWAATTPKHDGSWWPAFLDWLDNHCGAPAAPPGMGAPEAGLVALYDAPGEYVLVS
jgi:polyhydroxyalkanoate synthase